MKLSIEFDWKELAALSGAILIGLGAGVIGSSLLEKSNDIQESPESPVNLDGYNLYEIK